MTTIETMAETKYPEPLTWGDIMDLADLMEEQVEEATDLVEATTEEDGSQQQQGSQSSPQPRTPDPRGDGGHLETQTHQPAPRQGQEGGHQRPKAHGRRGGRELQGQQHHQAPGQRGGRGQQELIHHHQAPGQRGIQNQTPYNQGHPSRPPQHQVEARLRDRIEQLSALLEAEKEEQKKLTFQLDLSTKTIRELHGRVGEEKTARAEMEEVNAAAVEKDRELQQLVTSLQLQLQEEKQKSNHLSRERDLLRYAVLTARQVTDLERIQELESEGDALRKQVESFQREILRRETESREQLDTLKVQLQERSSSCLELASKLRHQEEVSQALLREVEELRVENKEENEEPSLHQENVEEATEEVTLTPDQDSLNTIQVSPETVEEPSKVERISLWRRLKKSLTPRSLRLYKHRRQPEE